MAENDHVNCEEVYDTGTKRLLSVVALTSSLFSMSL